MRGHSRAKLLAVGMMGWCIALSASANSLLLGWDVDLAVHADRLVSVASHEKIQGDVSLELGAGFEWTVVTGDFLRFRHVNSESLAAAKTADKWFGFTITPEAGQMMTIETISWRHWAGTGQTADWALFSSVDNYATAIGTLQTTGSTANYHFGNIGLENQIGAVTFRIYGWNAGTTTTQRIQGGGNLAVNNPGGIDFGVFGIAEVNPDPLDNVIDISYALYGRTYRFPGDQPHVPPDPHAGLHGTITLLGDSTGMVPLTVTGIYTDRLGRETPLDILDGTWSVAAGVPLEIPVSIVSPPEPGQLEMTASTSDPGIWLYGRSTVMSVYADPIVPAFPGAVGFGSFTPAGRGGEIYKVTTLEDYDSNEPPIPGSLRHAVEQSGPRIVVFGVSGTIHLKRVLTISNPYITIAGNTAPFPGITISHYPTRVLTDHVVLRHLRFRLSVDVLRDRYAQGQHSEWDSLDARGGEHVLFDHLSASHSVDETISMTWVDRSSMQHCLVAYSLQSIFTQPGTTDRLVHNFGGLAAYLGRPDRHAGVSSIYNAWINHNRRMPGISAVEDPDNLHAWVDVRHSLMYNWFSNAAGSEAPAREQWRQNYHLNFVGNYLKPGPNTPAENLYAGLTVRGEKNKLWMVDNIHHTREQAGLPTLQEELIRYIYSPVSSDHFLSDPAPSPPAPAPVVPGISGILTDAVGASLPARDSIDFVAVLDVLNDTGHFPFVDMETDTSPPLPELVSIRHVYHDEEEVFPVWWKRLQGLADDAVIDPHADANGDGYTNIEAYMYGLNLDDLPVLWAVPANNVNPLAKWSGAEWRGIRFAKGSAGGWSDAPVNETAFAARDGLTVLSSSTSSGAGSHGVRHVLDADDAWWAAGTQPGAAGARVDGGEALVFAFTQPHRLEEVWIRRMDLDSFGPGHDPSGAVLQGLRGWPDHWEDLVEAADWPAFSETRYYHRMVIPEAQRASYAAYRLVFTGTQGGDEPRIQHVGLSIEPLRTVNTGTPYTWLAENGLSEPSFEQAALVDHNGNGLAAWQEYIVGIDPGPAGAGQGFLLAGATPVAEGWLLRWPSVAGRCYTVQVTESLTDGFANLDGGENLGATPPENEWFIPSGSVISNRFFRILVRYPR